MDIPDNQGKEEFSVQLELLLSDLLGETSVHEVCKFQNLDMAEMILSRSSQLSILNNRFH